MTMTISQKGIALIKEFEGLRLSVYYDQGHVATIGIGHRVMDHEAFPAVITEAYAVQLLEADLSWTEKMMNRLITVPLTQNRWDALTSWTFNLGCGTLAKSTLLVKLNAGDFAAVPDLMLAFCHCNGVVNDGVLRRRKAEVALFTLL